MLGNFSKPNPSNQHGVWENKNLFPSYKQPLAKEFFLPPGER
jgi:hypothetical protein